MQLGISLALTGTLTTAASHGGGGGLTPLTLDRSDITLDRSDITLDQPTA